MKEVVVIMNKGEVYQGMYHTSIQSARNHIKFTHPKKKFKEPTKNTLVCHYTGMKFTILELKPKENENI